MNLEQLEKRRDELIQDSILMDDIIKEKEEKLWEAKVRCIVASELTRSARESALRSAGVVSSFYCNEKGEVNNDYENDR